MSTKPRIYLDFNATAPLHPAAREAVARALEVLGNPSSIHAEGRAARDVVERARDRVAALAGRPREQVVFTSGGTEANLLGVGALAVAIERRGGPRVVATTRLEHPSLRGAVAALTTRGWQLRELSAAAHGLPGEAPMLAGVGLLAAAAVNHELGTLLDPGVIGAARAAGALIHLDAVQAAGKLALGALDADALALSAHKLGGPQGAGAIVLAPVGDDTTPASGHQERGRRGGTENVLGLAGFGAAAEALLPDPAATWAPVAVRGDRLEAALISLGARIHGGGARRVGGTVNAAFPGAAGEAIVIALDLAGVAVSTGAACTSGSVQPSPVVMALGFAPELAREAVRFSLGRATTEADVDTALAALPAIVERARRFRA